MARMSSDEYKLAMIDALRRLQRENGGDVWFSLTAIQLTAGIGFNVAKQAMTEMMVEGWLHARHREDNPEKLLYRLRNEYR